MEILLRLCAKLILAGTLQLEPKHQTNFASQKRVRASLCQPAPLILCKLSAPQPGQSDSFIHCRNWSRMAPVPFRDCRTACAWSLSRCCEIGPAPFCSSFGNE